MSGRFCDLCGTPTPYTDWTTCESCAPLSHHGARLWDAAKAAVERVRAEWVSTDIHTREIDELRADLKAMTGYRDNIAADYKALDELYRATSARLRAERQRADDAERDLEEVKLQMLEEISAKTKTRADLAQRDRRIAELETALRAMRIELGTVCEPDCECFQCRIIRRIDAALAASASPAPVVQVSSKSVPNLDDASPATATKRTTGFCRSCGQSLVDGAPCSMGCGDNLDTHTADESHECNGKWKPYPSVFCSKLHKEPK